MLKNRSAADNESIRTHGRVHGINGIKLDPNWGYHQGGGSSRPPGSNTWQRQRYRGRGGGGWRPPSNDYYQPRQQRWQGHQHRNPGYHHNQQQFHGGGGGRFRPPGLRYHQPTQNAQYHRGPMDTDNIENWVSPEMWEDPWALLMQQFEPKEPRHGNDSSSGQQLNKESLGRSEADAALPPPLLSETVPDPQPSDDNPEEHKAEPSPDQAVTVPSCDSLLLLPKRMDTMEPNLGERLPETERIEPEGQSLSPEDTQQDASTPPDFQEEVPQGDE